jgi:ribonucleoside-diphosphate reductase beta chain
MSQLNQRKLYDTTAPNRSTGIINGESSNVLNWDDTRFAWANPLYKSMLANFWIPSDINMTGDMKQWSQLTDDERDTFKKIIGLLTFLDSIQTDYSGKIADYLTDSSMAALMQVLAFQEVVHNQSYSYVLSSLVPKSEQDAIFEYWKHDDILLERNGFIAKGYEGFVGNPTSESFIKSLVYDVVLEGLFFYAGFAFFYNLARNNKMVSTSTMINYINRDEQLHVRLFANIYKETLNENPELDTESMRQFTRDTFRKAADLETKWSEYIIGNKIDGIDQHDLADYIKFIANTQCQKLGVGKIFDGYTKNPLRWVTIYEQANAGKTDFFEQHSRQYTKVSDDNGFDEL